VRSSRLAPRSIALALLLLLSACSDADDGKVLRVAAMKDGVRALLEQSGALHGLPYRIEWSEFPSSAAIMEAVSADAVDTGMVGAEPFVFAVSGGQPVRAVRVYRSQGLSTVILVPSTSSVQHTRDLVGKRVATVRGSSGHQYLLSSLERDKIPVQAVQILFLTQADAAAAFASGDVDAWSTWGLSAGRAMIDGHARALDPIPGGRASLSIEVATEEGCARRGALLADFSRRLDRAFSYGGSHPGAHAATLARETGTPLPIAQFATRSTLKPVEPPIGALADLAAMARLFGYPRAAAQARLSGGLKACGTV